MAKNKRRISAAQRDKFAIEAAKILKRKGVLSKKTKLHGGKYVSRAVLKKVNEYRHVASDNYRTVKVPKVLAKAAKEEGYQVVQGNRIVAPTDKQFIARIKKGILSGLKPVKGGFMAEVTIPFTSENVGDLTNKLLTQSLDDLKMEDEQFAFSFYGNMSLQAFPDTKAMRERLEYYRPDAEIKALKFFRLHREDIPDYILPPERRPKRRRSSAEQSDRRYNKRSMSEKLASMPAKKAEKIRGKWREAAAERRAAIYSDPVKLAEYRKKARERAKNRKPK